MSSTIDLEAQAQAKSVVLPNPLPAHTHTHRSPTETTDPIDDFFGYTLSSSPTRESRHDRRISDAPPPPYAESLPVYTPNAEPATLARYLFKFGFLFPPFWIMGAIILLSPLRAPEPSSSSAWLPDKSESERQEIIVEMRRVEVKWAWRCLWALVVLIFIAVAAGIIAWAVSKK